MGGTKGYRSFRGRTSKGKIALAVLLVLIILAAVGFLWLQEYIVYDRDGSFHLELPWKTETPPAEEEVPPEDVEITIQEPEKPKGENIMLRPYFRANFKAGYWEAVFFHTKPLGVVPADMRAR